MVYMTHFVVQAFESLPAKLCQQLAGSMTHVHLPAGHTENSLLAYALLGLYCFGLQIERHAHHVHCCRLPAGHMAV